MRTPQGDITKTFLSVALGAPKLMPDYQRNTPDFPFDKSHPHSNLLKANPSKDVSNDNLQDSYSDSVSPHSQTRNGNGSGDHASDPESEPTSDPWQGVNPNVSTSPSPRIPVSYPKYHKPVKHIHWTRRDTDPRTGLTTRTDITQKVNPSLADKAWNVLSRRFGW